MEIVVKRNIDNLNYEEFRFVFFSYQLILDSYMVFSKESVKKRKFNPVSIYSRSNIFRNSTITEEEVPFPEEIKLLAMVEFVKKIECCKWSERKNNLS